MVGKIGNNKKSLSVDRCMPDTNVLIGYFLGKSPFCEVVENAIMSQTLVISSIVYAEFLVGASSKQQKSMSLLVDRFGLESVDRKVVDKAVAIRKSAYAKKKRVILLDCLIAASAIIAKAKLVTADKDFYGFSGLRIWDV